MCSYRFGVSNGGDKFKPPLSHPDQSARIFKVTEAEHYHVTVGYSSLSLEGQKPLLQLLLLLFVFIWLCQVSLVTCGTFDLCCGMWDLELWHVGSSSPTWVEPKAPFIGNMES